MEIRPGQGVGDVTLGDRRADVRQRLGTPSTADDNSDFYADLVVRYDAADTVELIEVPNGGPRGNEATLRGIQLTLRPMDDVVLDLHALGFASTASDIGYDFTAGFAIWSMGSWESVAPNSQASDRPVVEGVSVGKPQYFGIES